MTVPRFPRSTCAAAMIAATTALWGVPFASAIDVRQPESLSVLTSGLVRAYVPCTAPDTVTHLNQPACSAPVTSACDFGGRASFELGEREDFTPSVHVALPALGGPAVCDDLEAGTIVAGIRASADYDLVETPCPTGHCTYPDVTNHLDDLKFGGGSLVVAGQVGMGDGNFEFRGLTVVAPDGLPMAAPGVGQSTPLGERFVGNLTIPTPQCVGGPQPCDLPPPTSPCDFESGEVELTLDPSSAPRAHVVLRDVAGTSPLCTTGTYQMEATVRATVWGCGGTAAHPNLCTMVDQPVTVPLPVKGRNVDGGGLMLIGGFMAVYESTEILAVRILDPTGQPIAAAGVTGVTPAAKSRITIKGDTLRVQTFLPVPAAGQSAIDPATEPGLTVQLEDHNGPVYGVSIPQDRWQLQPPVGSRWTYADPLAAALNGVRSVVVKRVSKKGQQLGYAIDLRARGVDLSAADLASVTLHIGVPRSGPGYGYVFQWQEARTCTGAYPKLTCK